MYGDSAEFVANNLALTCMETCPDLDPEWPDALSDGASAPDGPGGTVESCKEAVSSRVDFPPAKVD
jgi:hypothetical protein